MTKYIWLQIYISYPPPPPPPSPPPPPKPAQASFRSLTIPHAFHHIYLILTLHPYNSVMQLIHVYCIKPIEDCKVYSERKKVP